MTCSRPGFSVRGIPQQGCWSGLPFPSGDLPGPGSEPVSSALAGGLLNGESPGKPYLGVSGRHSLEKNNETD